MEEKEKRKMNTKTRLTALVGLSFLASEQKEYTLDNISFPFLAAPISLDEDETGSSLLGKPSPEEKLFAEEKVLQSLVDQFLPKIMKEQEEKLGISYPRKYSPLLPYQDPEEFLFSAIPEESFVLPDIDFYIHIDDIEKRKAIAIKTCAIYNPGTDTMHFHKWEYFRNYDKPACSTAEEQCIDEQGFPLQYQNFKKGLEHELGHFYADKLHESLDLGSWPFIEKNEAPESKLAKRFIAEGIAEYFERTMTHGTDDFRNDQWPIFLENWANKTLYSGGYHLVKPILDRFGVQKGVSYLMMHVPDKEDLRNIPAYQQKVLKELEKTTSEEQ